MVSRSVQPSPGLYVGNSQFKSRDFSPPMGNGVKFPTRYVNDGSGRDNYIQIDVGGFLPPKKAAEFSQSF